MGYSMSWIAFRSVDAGKVHEKLGLRSAGSIADDSDFGTSSLPLAGARLRNGIYLLVFHSADGLQLIEEMSDRFAGLGECHVCLVEEHAMVSHVSLWRDGIRIWEVTHIAEQGLKHLHVDGSPPDKLTPILDAIKEQQVEHADGDVDHMFDAPVMLAAELTDYRHDRWAPELFIELNRLEHYADTGAEA